MKFEEACLYLDESFEVDPGTVIEVVRRRLKDYGMVGPRTTSKCLIRFDADDWSADSVGDGARICRKDPRGTHIRLQTRILIKMTASTTADIAVAKAAGLDMSDPKNFSEAVRRFPDRSKPRFDVTIA